MVLVMQSRPRFYNFFFQSIVMEVIGGLNSVSIVLSSKSFYLKLLSAYRFTLIYLKRVNLNFTLEKIFEHLFGPEKSSYYIVLKIMHEYPKKRNGTMLLFRHLYDGIKNSIFPYHTSQIRVSGHWMEQILSYFILYVFF
jgi:hypothetical protein